MGELYATRRTGDDPFAGEAVDYVDVLTGALNRRGLDEAAACVFDVPEESSRVVTGVALDVNGLKQVNDQHGHPRGDELLKEVALSLHEACASFSGSVVARVGGDEFTALVPDLDPYVVTETVEALCRRKDESRSFEPTAGISAGVSSTVLTGRAGATPSHLLAAADRAPYHASSLGRLRSSCPTS